jgi:hypothetical protein
MIAASVPGFSYYKDTKKSKKYSSQYLVDRILRSFASGKEYNLSIGRFVSSNDYAGKEVFLSKLMEQLKWATGYAPRLKKNKDGTFTVKYVHQKY